jgi:hypothetical protein
MLCSSICNLHSVRMRTMICSTCTPSAMNHYFSAPTCHDLVHLWLHLVPVKPTQHTTFTPLAACQTTKPRPSVTPQNSTRAGLKAPNMFAARYGQHASVILFLAPPPAMILSTSGCALSMLKLLHPNNITPGRRPDNTTAAAVHACHGPQ